MTRDDGDDDSQVQVGARVDRETYDAFRQYVEDEHGSVRGNLGRELTQAMEEYLASQYGASQIQRIDENVALLTRRVHELTGELERRGVTDHADETDTPPIIPDQA